ncbi:hypothetical protein QN277_016036 [Acacia crassicarpa]|uniref:Uncharacterized protein n=1 Tax=Acacia crassicarpa TaxID=499986 RepID=A0AAE1TAH0_9FABA|nr:hypothetical protein QN277_016036 [Acacia crassicarpa]
MEQQAKQELEMLESLYPDRFQYLKLDLKSFISHDHLSKTCSFHSSMVDTQESTSLDQRKRKKKRTANEDSEHSDQHDECYWSVKKKKKKDRVDLVLERAEACLRKIRQFKASLLCSNS